MPERHWPRTTPRIPTPFRQHLSCRGQNETAGPTEDKGNAEAKFVEENVDQRRREEGRGNGKPAHEAIAQMGSSREVVVFNEKGDIDPVGGVVA